MPTLVTSGDRLITAGGRESWLRRGSQPLSSWYGGGIVRLAGAARTVSFAQLYQQQPWVGIACNKLNRQVARLPLKVYERDSQGNKRRVTDHPLVDLLARPQPRWGPIHLKQAMTLPALVHGNSALGKLRERSAAPPSGLKPLRWPHLEPQVDDSACIYAWKDSLSGEFYAPEEIVHFGWMAPDGDVGVSPLEQLGVTLRAEDAVQRFAEASFNNGVRSPGAITLPPDAPHNKEFRDSIREEVSSVHGGVDNAFQFMVLGGGADVKDLAQTSQEAELIDVRKVNREEVAAAYDIPPPLIGILDNATYSNIETQHGMLYTDVLGPWLVMQEETFQAQLIDPEPAFEGLFVEYDLSEVLKGDKLKEIQALREAIGTGLMKPNEGRQIQNMPPEGDPNDPENPANKLYMPANNLQPLGAPTPAAGAGSAQQAVGQALARARDRVIRRTKAGADDPLDPDRFERELAQDLEPHTNGQSATVAAAWRKVVEQGVTDCGGDAARLERFFEALGA